MACNQNEYSIFVTDVPTPASTGLSASRTGNRVLIVSNSPETIYDRYKINPAGSNTDPVNFTTAFTNGTLYRCEIPITAGTTPLRIWMWHGNGTANSLQVLAALSLASVPTGATYAVKNIRYSQVAGANLDSMGKCLAKIQLAKAFDLSDPDVTLSAAESFVTWQTIPVGTDQTVGVCYECDIVASQAATLRFRSVATATGALGAWSDVVLTETRFIHATPATPPYVFATTHVRGWWPTCEATIACPAVDVKPTMQPQTSKVAVCDAGGVELGAGAFGQQPSDPLGLANFGCYGADLTYSFQITNSSPVGAPDVPYSVIALGRGTGGYGSFGAIQMPTGFAQGSQFGFDKIKRHVYGPTGGQVVDWLPLACDAGGNPRQISAASGYNYTLLVKVATGGACATPFDLWVSNGIVGTPPSPPPND